MKISGVILGNLPRKSNSRRIVKDPKTGKPRIIKSIEALNYEEKFQWQIKSFYTNTPLTGDLYLHATVFYQSRRSDLSVELFQDLLEKYGVIENDRQIESVWIEKGLDRENPRVEFEIGQIE